MTLFISWAPADFHTHLAVVPAAKRDVLDFRTTATKLSI